MKKEERLKFENVKKVGERKRETLNPKHRSGRRYYELF